MFEIFSYNLERTAVAAAKCFYRRIAAISTQMSRKALREPIRGVLRHEGVGFPYTPRMTLSDCRSNQFHEFEG